MNYCLTLVVLTVLLSTCSHGIYGFDDLDDLDTELEFTKSQYFGRQQEPTHLDDTEYIWTESASAGDENQAPPMQKPSSNKKNFCDANRQNCKDDLPPLPDEFVSDATAFIKKTAEEMGGSATPEKMMDATAEYVVETMQKYAKDFREGKLDWKLLLSSGYMKHASKLLLGGNLPGVNPLASAAGQLYQKAQNFFTM